jgi:hypothetical protein
MRQWPPASWRMPKPREMEKLAREAARHAESESLPPIDDGWWDAVLSDPRAAGKPWLPIQQRRLDEIAREMLRVECRRCMRIIEISRSNAVRLFGPHAVWKDVGLELLGRGREHRTGRHEEDGCWPDFRS